MSYRSCGDRFDILFQRITSGERLKIPVYRTKKIFFSKLYFRRRYANVASRQRHTKATKVGAGRPKREQWQDRQSNTAWWRKDPLHWCTSVWTRPRRTLVPTRVPCRRQTRKCTMPTGRSVGGSTSRRGGTRTLSWGRTWLLQVVRRLACWARRGLFSAPPRGRRWFSGWRRFAREPRRRKQRFLCRKTRPIKSRGSLWQGKRWARCWWRC